MVDSGGTSNNCSNQPLEISTSLFICYSRRLSTTVVVYLLLSSFLLRRLSTAVVVYILQSPGIIIRLEILYVQHLFQFTVQWIDGELTIPRILAFIELTIILL